MRGTRFEAIARERLMPVLPPEFRLHKKLIYRVSDDHVMTAFYANDSSFSADTIYLEAFALPLYRPNEHLSFSWGKRIGAFDAAAPAELDDLAHRAVTVGLPILDASRDARHLISTAKRGKRNGYDNEAIGRSWLMLGKPRRAIRALERAALPGDDDRDWARRLESRCRELADLTRSDLTAARARCVEEVAASRSALGLPD